ncbi:MAG TPA: NTP transferase domain-containing protein [Candidatus Binatia bacterium]|nr:NTP transferase domain-containing protein [Candidatus Binatia bacterium]
MITAIVLAGGRSSRFGADKLAADLGGRSLLAATIAAVASIADGVAVAGPDLRDAADVGETPVALFRDPDPDAGPLAALDNVLGHAILTPGHLAIVVGGDMPLLVPSVLVRMLDVLDVDPTVDAVILAAPGDRSPRRQVLPLAVRIGPAAEAARAAVEAGDRSLRALVDRLSTVELPAASWLPLDPSARTLTDVDTPTDLDRIRAT